MTAGLIMRKGGRSEGGRGQNAMQKRYKCTELTKMRPVADRDAKSHC